MLLPTVCVRFIASERDRERQRETERDRERQRETERDRDEGEGGVSGGCGAGSPPRLFVWFCFIFHCFDYLFFTRGLFFFFLNAFPCVWAMLVLSNML